MSAFALPSGRDTLWQIGTPDRTAAEFGFAEDFRRWGLWDTIADSLPDGVTFVVGKSWDRDWPFQMAVTQATDLSWRAPAWRVEFDVPTARAGKVALTLGIASYEGKQTTQLRVSVNGEPVGALMTWWSPGLPTAAGFTPRTKNAGSCLTLRS